MSTTARSAAAAIGNVTAAGEAVEFADTGGPGEFREQSTGSGDAEPAGGEPCPKGAEGFANEFAVSAPGKNPKPHGKLLHQVEYRNQNQLQQQQAISPLHPALAGGDDAADIGVGQHHDHARAKHSEEAFWGSRHEAIDGAWPKGIRWPLSFKRESFAFALIQL